MQIYANWFRFSLVVCYLILHTIHTFNSNKKNKNEQKEEKKKKEKMKKQWRRGKKQKRRRKKKKYSPASTATPHKNSTESIDLVKWIKAYLNWISWRLKKRHRMRISRKWVLLNFISNRNDDSREPCDILKSTLVTSSTLPSPWSSSQPLRINKH